MKTIASFTVDHDRLLPGLYVSRKDGDVVTYDLRFIRPNTPPFLPNPVMHTIEHLAATYVRNSRFGSEIVYFGPMGCQTGFYFLYDGAKLTDGAAIALLKRVFDAAAVYDGPMPGRSAEECGNYRNLDVALARCCCAFYVQVIRDWTEARLAYPTK